MGQRRLEHLSLAFGSLPEPQGVGMFLLIGLGLMGLIGLIGLIGLEFDVEIWCWLGLYIFLVADFPVVLLGLKLLAPLRSMILTQCRHWGCGLGPNLSIGIPLFAMAALKKWRIMPKAPISQTSELPEAPRFFGHPSQWKVKRSWNHLMKSTSFHLGPSFPPTHYSMFHQICQGLDTRWFLLQAQPMGYGGGSPWLVSGLSMPDR